MTVISWKVESRASPRKVDYPSQSSSMTQLIQFVYTLLSSPPRGPLCPSRILYAGICATKNGPYVVWKRLINAPPSSTNYECGVHRGASGWTSVLAIPHKSLSRASAATHVSCPTRCSLNARCRPYDGVVGEGVRKKLNK